MGVLDIQLVGRMGMLGSQLMAPNLFNNLPSHFLLTNTDNLT